MDLSAFRGHFPVTGKRAYLFSGAIAPAGDTVRLAMERWINGWSEEPLVNYDSAFEDMARLRGAIGELLGVPGSQVALSENTSRASNSGVRLLTSALPGSNVVVDRTTYPSSRYPWMVLSNAEVRVAHAAPGESASEAVASCVDDQTIAVAVSHVDPRTGFRHDLDALASITQRHGAALMVDLAQSAGVVPLSPGLEGIDVAVGTTMKWLLGPPGIGYLYVRAGLAETAPGLDVGYLSFAVDGEGWPQASLPARVADSRRFELGLGNLAGLSAAVEGIKLLEQLGVATVFERVSDLAGKCISGLKELGLVVRTPEDVDHRGGVVAFEFVEARALAAYLRGRGVDIGGYSWGLGRVDPHAFNDGEDVERLLEGVREFFELPSTKPLGDGLAGGA
jgi:selenocysteine lyase/cysteine desulfurase